MTLVQQIRLVMLHGVLFGVLAFLSFLGMLTFYIQFISEPLASALTDLNSFAPVIGVGAFILAVAQGALDLWLRRKSFVVFWAVNVFLAFIFGGLAAFFSMWAIWVIVALLNIFLVWFFMVLVQRELVNKKL
jgi:hypothetical protein